MNEDKASTSNKGKDIHEGSASEMEMAKDFLQKHFTGVGPRALQRNGSESRRSECCIYRVPKPLRDVNSEAYAPLRISIGPLHRGNERLEAMEEEKLKYFNKFRDGMDENKMCHIVIIIKNKEELLRRYYSEEFKLIESSDDFAKMIMLDAVFIIQLFSESNDDTESRMTDYHIREDLMLLENQLPLFIIKEIYEKIPRGQNSKPIPFLDLATCHLRKYLRLQGVETSPCVVESKHFTDLLRNLMLSGAIKRSYSLDPVKLNFSAVMLHKAGVKFQVTRDECMVNIKFDKGVLEIPHLKVDRKFERLVRNIMAMEQCLYEGQDYICSYIKFMGDLIKSAEDVGLLVENGIILHWLGEDAEVSKMIKNLCKNIGDNDICFGDISKELNAHYENPWNHVKHVYFRNMWRGTGTITGAILLILTFIQTISSVKSLF